MTLDEVEPHFRELLATYEAYRRIGFTPSEIYAAFDEGKLPMMAIVQGEKSFVLQVDAPLEVCTRAMVGRWQEVAGWWNSAATPEERNTIWSQSQVRKYIGVLLAQVELALGLPKKS